MYARLRLGLPLLLLCGACVSSRAKARHRVDMTVLTQDDLVDHQYENVLEAVQTLRSNWLNDEPERPWTTNEVERGWEAATEAEATNADGRTRTGLPVRRPGGRLVPGGVTPEPSAVARDPEAIRNRLAAHSAGVSRGRAAAAAQPLTDDYAHEETGPA